MDARGLRGWQLLGRVTVSCWSSLTEWAVCRKIFSKASKHTRGRQIGRAVESAADAIHDRGYIFGRWEGTNWMGHFCQPPRLYHAPTHPQTQLKVGAAGKATRMAPWSVCDARDSIGQAPQRHGNHGLGWRGTGDEFAVVSKAPSTQAHDQQTEASERLRMSP